MRWSRPASKPSAFLFDPVVGYFEVSLTDKRVISTSVDLPTDVVHRLVDAGRDLTASGMLKGSSLLVMAGSGARTLSTYVIGLRSR